MYLFCLHLLQYHVYMCIYHIYVPRRRAWYCVFTLYILFYNFFYEVFSVCARSLLLHGLFRVPAHIITDSARESSLSSHGPYARSSRLVCRGGPALRRGAEGQRAWWRPPRCGGTSGFPLAVPGPALGRGLCCRRADPASGWNLTVSPPGIPAPWSVPAGTDGR